MTDGEPASDDPSSPMPDDLPELDDAQLARLAARIWSRLIGRNPELRDELDD